MKKSSFLYILFVSGFLWLAGTNTTNGQEAKILPKQRTTPERAAEGQTKWMINSLHLDQKLFEDIYRINLKYQIISDSVHVTDAFITAKQEAYVQCTQSRNEELKKVIPPDAFDKLMSLIEAEKEKAAAFRASVQK